MFFCRDSRDCRAGLLDLTPITLSLQPLQKHSRPYTVPTTPHKCLCYRQGAVLAANLCLTLLNMCAHANVCQYVRSRRKHTSITGRGSSSSLSSQHTHTYFCHGTWFILFFIFSTYPPPFAKLRVCFSLLPLTPIPAMLTAQACNRLRVFFAGSLTPQTLGQHCIRRGMGGYSTD